METLAEFGASSCILGKLGTYSSLRSRKFRYWFLKRKLFSPYVPWRKLIMVAEIIHLSAFL